MRFNAKSLRRLAPAWIAIGVALLIAVGASAQPPGRSTDPGWIADPNTGCKVWNPGPEPEESVTWSGSCVDGFADGHGVEQWYRGDQKGNRLEGQFYRGRSTGTLTVTYPNGVQYIGNLSASGGPSGVGTIIWTNGDRFEGKVLDGLPLPEGDGAWTFKNDTFDLTDNHELRAWGRTLNARANRLHELGRYTEAETIQKQALAVREKALGPNHPNVAASLIQLSNIYFDQGNYTKAEALEKRALDIHERAIGLDLQYIAVSLHRLARIYLRQGRYNDAEALQKRALAIEETESGPDHQNVAVLLHNLAGIYIRHGHYTKAEALQKRALAITEKRFAPDHPKFARSLYNLAVIFSGQGRYAEAEALQKRALAIEEKALGPDHPDVASYLAGLASVYSGQGRYAEAEAVLKRALAIEEKAFGPDHLKFASSLNNLAVIYARQSRYAEAEALLKQTLAINEKALGPDHPDVANSLGSLAAIYADQRRYSAAALVLRPLIERGWAKISALSILYNTLSAKLIDQHEVLSMSLSIAQTSRVSGARDAMSKLAQRFSTGRGERAEIIRRDQDLGNQLAAMDEFLTAQFSKVPERRNKDAEANIRQRIAEIEAERTGIAATLAARFPDYVALTKPPVLSVADIQALLADDEALIAFDVAEKGYTWVITRETADWTEVATTAATLTNEVQALRSTLVFGEGKQAKPFDAALAYKIYQQTLGPLADKFAGKKRLSVYVNGALSGIPLQLLVTKDPTGKAAKDIDWLVKSAAITNLPSIYSLKASRRQLPPSAANKPMVAFADPVFSREARAQAVSQQIALRGMPSFYNGTQLDAVALAQSLPQLPGTRREVEAVARSLGAGQEDLHFGLQATVRAVQEAKLDQYRVVYFATHALVAGDLEKFAKARAEPALALTFPEKPTENAHGLLPASEVAQLKLDADWVVLSACNTAAGDQTGAEALSGLARAFIYAGARSLLVSHWEVSDTATSSLMRRVFEISRTNPSLSHGEALREAELRTLAAARNDDEAHPRLWAPFVVVGEPLKPGTSIRGQP